MGARKDSGSAGLCRVSLEFAAYPGITCARYKYSDKDSFVKNTSDVLAGFGTTIFEVMSKTVLRVTHDEPKQNV